MPINELIIVFRFGRSNSIKRSRLMCVPEKLPFTKIIHHAILFINTGNSEQFV